MRANIQPWGRRQRVSPKRRYSPAVPHRVATQKNDSDMLNTAVRRSDCGRFWRSAELQAVASRGLRNKRLRWTCCFYLPRRSRHESRGLHFIVQAFFAIGLGVILCKHKAVWCQTEQSENTSACISLNLRRIERFCKLLYAAELADSSGCYVFDLNFVRQHTCSK